METSRKYRKRQEYQRWKKQTPPEKVTSTELWIIWRYYFKNILYDFKMYYLKLFKEWGNWNISGALLNNSIVSLRIYA